VRATWHLEFLVCSGQNGTHAFGVSSRSLLAMCGRVRLSSDVSEIKLVFSIPPHRPTPNFAPSWNVAPTDPVPIVLYDTKAGERSLDVMRWGLVPFWAKDIKVKLAAEVAGWMKKAAAQDAAEDRQHGGDRRGDELPDWVANKERRLAKIREAKAALEAEAQAAAGQGEGEDSEVAVKRGRKDQPPSGVPEDNAQRNFTDPESRIMKTKDGFIQGYNAQAAVDAEHQIIISCDLTNQGADSAQLLPLIDQIKANTEVLPKQVSADAGYASEPI
jgi:hypothetical protein